MLAAVTCLACATCLAASVTMFSEGSPFAASSTLTTIAFGASALRFSWEVGREAQGLAPRLPAPFWLAPIAVIASVAGLNLFIRAFMEGL